MGRASNILCRPEALPAWFARLLLAAVVLFVFPAFAEQAEFCIAGSVRNAFSGEPMRHAAVTIPQAAILTDAAGAFRFCGLPPGSYYANAEKPGFVPAGSRVVLGPSREDLELRLSPLSVIRGKVTDDAGEPLANVRIQLLSMQVAAGHRHVRAAATAATDDRGQYRLANIAAGRYYLRAAGWDGGGGSVQDEAFAPVYYGGGSDVLSAGSMNIEPGPEVSADFSVTLRPAYRVSGAVAGLSPLLPSTLEVLGATGDPIAAPVTLDSSTGKFRIDATPPGSYTLRVTQGEGAQRRRGELALQVHAGTAGAVLRMADSIVLKGRVRIADADPAASSAPKCTIDLWPADPWAAEGAAETTTEPSGEFAIEGVLPGRYRLRMDCASGYIAQARMGEVDLMSGGEVTVAPGATPPAIEAVLATDGGTVEITPSAGGEAGPAWVVLLPASGNEFQMRFARLRTKLTLSGVAPGDYQVYAWSGSPEAFEYGSAEARQAWAGRAESVHAGVRDRQTISVKIASGDAP